MCKKTFQLIAYMTINCNITISTGYLYCCKEFFNKLVLLFGLVKSQCSNSSSSNWPPTDHLAVISHSSPEYALAMENTIDILVPGFHLAFHTAFHEAVFKIDNVLFSETACWSTIVSCASNPPAISASNQLNMKTLLDLASDNSLPMTLLNINLTHSFHSRIAFTCTFALASCGNVVGHLRTNPYAFKQRYNQKRDASFNNVTAQIWLK